MRTPLTIAHRGASAAAPENTLAAVRAALSVGVDMVEVDVQRTRDGELVLLHDVNLVRTTDVRRRYRRRATCRVSEFTLAELRRLDAGSWHASPFAGEAVPTLTEVAALVRASASGLLLELKRPDLHPGVVADLAAAIPGLGLDRRLVVQSFDFAAMKELKTRRPYQRVGLVGRPPVEHLPALSTWAEQVNPCHARLDAAYVDAVHEQGMNCMVWTVDRPRAVRRVAAMGVDGVISNRPTVCAEALSAHPLLPTGRVGQGSASAHVRHRAKVGMSGS